MSADNNFEVATTTLTDAVHDSLRQRIASGEIQPGEKVTEARVAREYNVARPTAKACIERLVTNGLLQRSTHKSATVTALTAADIDDLFFARKNIELAAARRVAAHRKVPRSMVEAQRALDIAGEFDDRQAVLQADIAFHSNMVSASGSSRLERMHRMLRGEIMLTIGSSKHESAQVAHVAAEHARVLSALEAGDADLAVELLAAHLDAAYHRVRDGFSDTPPTVGP